MNPSRDLVEIYDAAISAVDPFSAVINALKVEGDSLSVSGATYDLSKFERIIVVGAGKASGKMAQAVEKVLGSRISEGLVIVKAGYRADLEILEQLEASHPVPDAVGMGGTKRIFDLVKNADEKTLIIFLLSGGASSLLVLPSDDLTLEEKQQATSLLLKCGAAIDEVNSVRKHLSKVKGGRLAEAAFPAAMLTLIVSDVIGDRLDVIGSGPTVQDDSTFSDALSVIKKYGLLEAMPKNMLLRLQKGMACNKKEMKLENSKHVIVANNRGALEAAKEMAKRLGYGVELISSSLQGDAREAAAFLSSIAQQRMKKIRAPYSLFSGGETTVRVKGPGKGGRNQELALSFAIEIEGVEGITLLSAGTDGTDGPTDAAGAMVNGETCRAARKLGLDPEHFLKENDSYRFFDELDRLSGKRSHFKPGQTGTNVMDIQVILLENH